jgi:hypothetical protein
VGRFEVFLILKSIPMMMTAAGTISPFKF